MVITLSYWENLAVILFAYIRGILLLLSVDSFVRFAIYVGTLCYVISKSSVMSKVKIEEILIR